MYPLRTNNQVFSSKFLTHVVLLVALVHGDPLHLELRHPEVLGHGHGVLALRPIPRQDQLLRRL